MWQRGRKGGRKDAMMQRPWRKCHSMRPSGHPGKETPSLATQNPGRVLICLCVSIQLLCERDLGETAVCVSLGSGFKSSEHISSIANGWRLELVRGALRGPWGPPGPGWVNIFKEREFF